MPAGKKIHQLQISLTVDPLFQIVATTPVPAPMRGELSLLVHPIRSSAEQLLRNLEEHTPAYPDFAFQIHRVDGVIPYLSLVGRRNATRGEVVDALDLVRALTLALLSVPVPGA